MSAAAQETVERWGAIFDELYAEEAAASTLDPSFDVSGWRSTYTGEPLPETEMREWLADTVHRILSLEPRRVLEIGCGTGLVLFRVAPRCESYLGTDVSALALAKVEPRLGTLAGRVRLERRPAEDFSGIPPASLDLVILNSVVQYFPDLVYLERVLAGAIRVLRPGGAVFLGDVRSAPLLPAFHASVEIARADPGLPLSDLRARVRDRARRETELTVDPSFFAGLAERLRGLGRIEVCLKRGRARNELTGFRYQVVLRVGEGVAREGEVEWIPHPPGPPLPPPLPPSPGEGGSLLDALGRGRPSPGEGERGGGRGDGGEGREGEGLLDALRHRLAAAGPDEILGLRDLPNARVASEVAALRLLQQGGPETIGDLRTQAAEATRGAIDPWDLETLADEVGHEVELGAARHGPEGRFDAVFRRRTPYMAEPLAAWLPPPAPPAATDLRAWNDTAARFAESGPVHRLVAARAAEHPEAPALRTTEGVLSFRDLDLLTNQLARHLRRLGVRPGVRVGLALEHPAEVVIAILAVWKAGGAYLPLDPGLPRERLAFFLADSRPAVVLAQGETLGGIDLHGARIVDPERDAAAIAREPVGPPENGAGEGDPAYLLYTSGTTGTPKAVLVAHAQLANTLLSTRRRFGFGPGDTALALAPFSFDIFLFEVFAPLLAGGSVLPLARREVLDLSVLSRAVEQATMVHAVPALLRQIVAPHPPGPPLPSPPSRPGEGGNLRAVFTGGDLVPPDLVEAARGAFPRARVTVLYGPTETAILASCSEVGERPVNASLIGRPLDNAALWLLDEQGAVVPAGEAGEICIGGAGVSLGYWARPALTAERFVPDPFVDRPGARLYRTGDLGRLGPDGEVEFLGRVDQQVKIRGFRVETGEIEAALRSCPGVADAAVIAREGGAAGDRWLAAFWIGRSEEALLRESLAERLPEYMIPSAFVRLHSLPLTPHGKVDRKALARQEIAPDRSQERADAPRTPAEELLAGLWREVLGTEQIGAHDRFLDLGGHSLLAARLVTRARQLLGVQIPLRRLLEGASVADLAAELETARRGEPLPPVVPIPRDRPLDLSFGQQRLWFLDRLAGGGTAYNFTFALHLQGRLDLAALRRTFDEIVARHEVLRTVFALDGDRPVQVVAPPAPQPMPRLDLRALPAPVRAAELGRLLRDEGARRFDLSRGPLFRTLLIHLAEGEDVLSVANHHAVFDDQSAALLAREVAALYAAFIAGRPSPLAPLPVQYGDFAVWQRSRLAGERLERELEHWRRALGDGGDGEPARLATDRRRGLAPSRAAQLSMDPLPLPAARALRALGRSEGTTLFMTLLAGFQALLHRWTGEPRITVGTPVATRPDAATEGLLGFFLNTLALTVDCSGATFREMLRRTREAALDAYAHQDVPFEKVVEAVQPDRRSGLQPLFQALFQVRTPWPALDLPGLRIRPMTGEHEHAAPFDLALSVEEREDGLIGGIEYDATLFEPATIEALLADFRALLAAVASDPDQPVSALPVAGDPRPAGSTAPEPPAVADEEQERRARLASRKEGLSEAKRAALAKLIRGRGKEGKETPRANAIPRRDVSVPPPLSFAQERLWFLDRLEPGSASYNMLFPLRLRGRLAPDALEAALGGILRRHEGLRATFSTVDGSPVQALAPFTPRPLPRIDLGALPAARRDEEAGRLTAAELAHPFDLADGPLVRSSLVRLADDAWLLLWNAHHIVFDGWSLGLLLQELGELYRSALERRPAALPALPVQYADFAAWQRDRLQGEALERELAWWRERLAGAPPVLDLPADRPRPDRPGDRSGSVTTLLSREATDRLAALARAADATLFMVLLAAFDVLLGRLTGRTDLLVGTPIAGRTRAETEGLIGFFLNTLVLRIDLAGDPTFRDLLARVREAALGAYAHQEIPFEKLVEDLAPRRDLSRTPLFQVFFNLVNLGEQRLELPGLSVEPAAEALDIPAKFDLTLYAGETPQGLGFTFLYDAGLFDAARMEALAGSFVGLLEQVGEDAGGRGVGGYALAPTPRGSQARGLQARGLHPGLPHVAPSGGLVSIPDRIEAAAGRDPGRVAVRFAGGGWTYGELIERSRGMVEALHGQGIREGDLVAVTADRGPDLAAVLFGILQVGAAFLILDPAHPESRRQECLRQARADFRVEPGVGNPRLRKEKRPYGATPPPHQGDFPEGKVSFPSLGFPTPGPAPDVISAPPGHGGVGLAYLAFTSGSTGTPKGILGTQPPLLAFLDWYRKRFDLGPEDRFALLSGLSHDPLLRDLLTPLILGACLCIPAPGVLTEPAAFRAWLADEGVTVLHLTPSLADFLLRDASPGEFPAVRLALFGGEPLTWAQAARFRRAAPGAVIVNVYGATETPQVMAYFVVEEDRSDSFRVPVGQGRDGVELLVLTPHGDLCGAGELGEVWIRSPWLTIGYLDDPAATAERFRPDPFGDPAARLYRTGDLGRYRPDGAVEIAGRADTQLKIRGHRIEPAEIEAALTAHPEVREAAADVREVAGEPRLVAWIVPEPGPAPSRSALRPYLLGRLPEPLVPAEYVVIETLPRTPNGKLDRRALPAPAEGEREEAVAPRDPVEMQLARIWEELLGQPVGVRDDFFELGGHSLLAVRLMAAIRAHLGRELPLSALFQGPTVERMAVLLRRKGDLVRSPLVPIRNGAGRPLVCVHPAGGNVTPYAALSRALGDRPLWAMEARGLAPGETPLASIEEMASAYVEALRSVQPEGPYALIGWSLGGLIAWEMARQLSAAGQTIESLVLLDTNGHDRSGRVEDLDLPPDEEILLGAVEGLFTLPPEELRGVPPEERTAFVFRRVRDAGVLPPDFGPEDARRFLDVYKANIRAGQAYRPGTYAGDVVLFRAEAGLAETGDETLGWDRRVGGTLRVLHTPGTHRTMVEMPHVTALAIRLQALLSA